MTRVSPARRIAWPLVKLSVFAAVTLVLTGLLASSLGAPPISSLWSAGAPSYRARFTDVTGVLPGDDVRIAGVKVGRVLTVRLVDNATAELRFTVDGDVPLPTSVRATIRYRNLVGQRYLSLAEGPGASTALGGTLRPGATIPLSQTAPALDLTTLFNGFQPLFSALNPHDVNTLAYEIIQVLQGEAGTVAGLLQHSASLISTLADRDAVIARVIGNLNSVLSTLDSHRAVLSQTVDQLQQFVSGLSADRAAIGQAVTSIGNLTAATGDLVQKARPDLSADIGGLGSLAGILNDNGATIDATLARLPGEYQALTRTASYGSWFNFFVCDFDGRVSLPGAGSVNPATLGSPNAACTGGGGQ